LHQQEGKWQLKFTYLVSTIPWEFIHQKMEAAQAYNVASEILFGELAKLTQFQKLPENPA